MKKRILAMLLVVCALLLCACSDDASKDNTNKTDNKQSQDKDTVQSDSVLGEGDTHITVIVVDDKEKDTKFEIYTDAEMLGDALAEAELVQGDETEYGLFINTVNGLTVDSNNQEWWCITKGGEVLMTGVDTTPIEDGDTFELTFTVGY